MLSSAIWILLIGFFASQIARRLRIPPLIGMILAGIVLGPEVGHHISPGVLDAADRLKTVAVMIILMKAGLGLDREKLAQQGTVALRLGVLPGIWEAIIVAIASMFLFKFNFATGLLLGCIVGAESPAVIVPGMLQLKSAGWGVSKGIPDAILTGSALSDVVLLLLFSLLLNLIGQGELDLNVLQLLPWQVLLQVGLAVLIGYLTARGLISLLRKQNWTQNTTQDIVITAVFALLLVIIAEVLPYFSGYLAVMALGFFLVTLDPPLGRRLRTGFDVLWVIGEIVLFVLLGASIQLDILGNMLLPGILLLAIGLLLGRTIGWYLSTLGSNWNWRERWFLLPGNSAKATVQAAIGGIPLERGIEGGETMLAIAALSILITAPIGAWAIPTFAPKLLAKGTIDPRKISLSSPTLFLAAIDTSGNSLAVLTKVADLARRCNGEVIVWPLMNKENTQAIGKLHQQTKQLLLDIDYQFITTTHGFGDSIVLIAEEYGATAIVLGKQMNEKMLPSCNIPIILV